MFVPFVDEPVFVSRADLAEAKRIGLIKDGSVIYNGLDESSLKFLPRNEAQAALEKKIGHSLDGGFIIGSIGRLSYQKNYGFLIETFPDILKIKPNAIAIVIGDGPNRAKYENHIAALGLKEKFFFLGELTDAPQYLKAFDLFVLPSRYEGLPVTLTECLFAGTPVIASNVGGNGEIVPQQALYELDNKDGFLDGFSRTIGGTVSFIRDNKKIPQFTAKEMTRKYLSLLTNSRQNS